MRIIPSIEFIPGKSNVGSALSVIGPDFTFSRTTTPVAGVATRVNASGLIETVPDNVLRLDYPIGGGCPAALIEPAATNLALQSEAFNVNWSLSRASAFGSGSVANAVTAPDGTMTADYIQQQTGETLRGGVFTSFTIVSGTIYTFSVFAKKSDSNFLQLGAAWLSAGDFVEFNLDTGTIGTVVSGITARIVDFGSGWYRCSITGTSQFSGARNHFIYQNEVPTAVPGTGIYIWGAQLEVGSIATTYIPTTTAAVSRAAEVISASGALVSGLIGQTEGTIYLEFQFNNVGNAGLISVESTNNQNRVLFANANTTCNVQVRAANINVFTTGIGTLTVGQLYKVAIGYSSGNTKVYLNGSAVITNTWAFTFDAALSRISLGNYGNFSDLVTNSRIRALALYTTRLTNATLESMTSLSQSYAELASSFSYTVI